MLEELSELDELPELDELSELDDDELLLGGGQVGDVQALAALAVDQGASGDKTLTAVMAASATETYAKDLSDMMFSEWSRAVLDVGVPFVLDDLNCL